MCTVEYRIVTESNDRGCNTVSALYGYVINYNSCKYLTFDISGSIAELFTVNFTLKDIVLGLNSRFHPLFFYSGDLSLVDCQLSECKKTRVGPVRFS